MNSPLNRREFLHLSAAAGALYLTGFGCQGPSLPLSRRHPKLISPGCRKSKVKVARIYMGTSGGLWPKPKLDLKKEIRFYESEFAKHQEELADVDFVVDELVTSAEQIKSLEGKLKAVDGILAIHLNMGIWPILYEILLMDKPTTVFAAPYSGHTWIGFGGVQKQKLGEKMVCLLTNDYSQLTTAIRPFRAIHHLREAKILNVTTRDFADYAQSMKDKFGTEIKPIELQRMIKVYDSIDVNQARMEGDLWIRAAEKVVEPTREDIVKSARMALAFERLMDEEEATVITVDCYRTMYKPLCQKYAFPCLGFARINNMGLGGICESDLQCAMTHIIFQGLCGKPGFISDPTIDESNNAIILAHCLGTPMMDGPDKAADPFKIRTIMEREEGVVIQPKMQCGRKVTQAKLVGTDFMPFFTGQIIDAPVGLKDNRGCRTKITVKVDGCVTKLWKNYSHGLHRVSCYDDITTELRHFCRFTGVTLADEANDDADMLYRQRTQKATT